MSGRGAVALGGQPAVLDDVRIQEREAWGGLLHAFLEVHRYGAYPVLLALEGDAETLTAVVENQGLGPLVAGRLTLAGATGARATVTLEGAFAPGEAAWARRARRARPAPLDRRFPVE